MSYYARALLHTPGGRASPRMNLQQRNNIHVQGDGPRTMVFAHGFGCDQNMWRFMAPVFADRFKVVTFDLVGSGKSDVASYDKKKYSSRSTQAFKGMPAM